MYLLCHNKDFHHVQITNPFRPDHVEGDERFDSGACKNLQCVGDHEVRASFHISPSFGVLPTRSHPA